MCKLCERELERKIGKIDGIKSVSIGFMTQRMEIECRDEESEKIIKEVKKTIKKRRTRCNSRKTFSRKVFI